MTQRATYAPGGAEKTEKFFDSLYQEAKAGSESAVLDSVSSGKAIESVLDSVANESGVSLPASVVKTVEALDDQNTKLVLDSVLAGMDVYQQAHGVLPTADVTEYALHQGFAAAQKNLDGVGSTEHSDNFSAQPNRVVVAITAALAEAIPFATYLPADIQSNESRLAIVSHLAGSSFGGYAQGALMDGIALGETYLASERRIELAPDAERDLFTGQITTREGSGDGVILLRGRSIIFVNGRPVAYEQKNQNATAANSPISGVVTIAGTDHAISGTVTIATGAFSIAFAPALPANYVVHAEGYIDYEKQPQLAPELMTSVQTYELYAAAFRAIARQSIDSRTQYTNEINVDLSSESLMAIRNQFAQERHYLALKKAKTLAMVNTETFNFDYSTQIAQKNRAQIWQDFLSPLGVVDQKMAELTMDHGITHLYVGKNVAAQWLSLGREHFEPSGLVARPGIYRLGRLFGRFEVYYTPKVVTEASDGTSAQVLAIGRSQQVARCPLVLGDAVPPTVLPLGRNSDLKEGVGFYARNFTQVNPHEASAMGCALLTVTNLK